MRRQVSMKTVACLIIFGALSLGGCARKSSPEFVTDPELQRQFKSFTEEKESQARSLAAAGGKKLPSKAEELFWAVENGDWETATNDFAEMKQRVDTENSLYGSWWQPVLEVYGAAEQFALGDERYAAAYGNDIIQSIPDGSIYFGATDPGRFIVTAMEKSQINGDPFFLLSQNPLIDNSYLDYLRSMHGNKIYIPTAADSQKCYDDYLRDFQQRQIKHQLLPGEEATNGPDGKMHVNSHMGVIQIYSSLARLTFDRNTNKEFYVEEGFPLEWMYPCLEPHGLIFKMNGKPLTELSAGIVKQDNDYWTKTITPMIGDWLDETTSIQNVAAFAEKVYLHHDFGNFAGDPAFVENEYSQRMFSKERSSIAGLYAWRAQHGSNSGEQLRMAAAADFAFRQSWALCPDSPETVFSYIAFLMSEKRSAQAAIVAETAEKFHFGPAAENLNQLVSYLKHH
jgi:hypothetical protein